MEERSKVGTDADVMHQLGKISGMLEAMDKSMDVRFQGMDTRFQLLHDDMVRSYKEHSRAISDLRNEVRRMVADAEARSETRVKELTERIEKLEAEDKRMLEKVAGVATAGGGIGSALVVGGIEIIKRLF